MKIKNIVVICISFFSVASFAQQQAMPGRILIRIKPEAIAAFRAAFASPEINDRKFDPQKFSLKDNIAIANLFSLPSSLKVTSLKPFIPQHNIVLENLREHTNPILFADKNINGVNLKETADITQLRGSEEKISRCFELVYDEKISPESAILLLKKSGIVEIAERRYLNKTCFTPNDPLYNQQYSLPLIHASEAWDVVRCDSTMLVADDDVGTDWTHPDLANAVFVNTGETGLDSNGFDKRSNGIDDDGDGFVDDWHGWDFAGNDGTAPDNDPNTTAEHGTHTAGIMAASGNNGIGICGVAFGSKVLLLKCGDNSGQYITFGYEGIVYAADRNAKVVNNSWGGTGRSQIGQDIIDYANAKNCVVVAACGNSSVFQDFYPSSYDHVLSVAAVDANGTITNFSNYSTHVTVSAPGSQVLSTVPNSGYLKLDGTSMASPTAAGGIALVRQRFPNLTADQAVQRLRVTSDALTSDQDIHPGFTGKGIINVKRAVSNDPIYSARLQSVEILDDNHSGILVSGEGADIILHVRNYLSPLTNLQAKIEYLNDTAQAISANSETVQFGKANTLETIQNFQGSYHIKVSKDVPPDYTILVRMTLSSTVDGYANDVDYFSLIINQAYLDLNQNNLSVTFDSKGGIGYNDPPNNAEGKGFVWTKAPSDINIEGRDVLSEGGLMIGVDDSARIVASAPGEFGDSYSMQDYRLSKAIHYVSPSDHSNAAQELETIFTDVNTDPSLQVGVSVEEKSYAFLKDLSANSVVVDYVIHKRIVDSVSYATDSTAAALFLDWDIGSSGSLNEAYISAFDTAIGVTKRIEATYPYVGVKLISDLPSGSSLNFYAIDNDGSNGSVNKYSGYTRSAKWQTMTTPRQLAGIGDVAIVYGLKNLPLRSQDSVHLTFVIGMAESEELLKQTIDKTQTEWLGVNSVRKSSATDYLTVTPNPFGNKLHINWKSGEPTAFATIEVSDALGRIRISRKVQGMSLELSDLNLPSGSYILTARQGSSVFEHTLICMP